MSAAPAVVGFFFADTFTRVNLALNTFVNQFSSNIITQISGLVAAGLVLTFIFHGLAIVRGYSSEPIMDTAMKMFRISIIVAIALTVGTYQTYIVNSLISVPDTLVSSLMGNSMTGATPLAGENAASALDQILYQGMGIAGQYTDKAKVGLTGTNLMPYIYAGLVILGTVLCVVVAAFWIFASKIILSILLGIGPMFIVALVWQPTQQYFFSWVSAILNTILTVVFVAGIFAIFGQLFTQNLAALTPDDSGISQLTDTGITSMLGILTCGILFVLPNYVGQLTGASGGGIFGAMRQIASAAPSAGRAASNAITSTANRGASLGRAATAYKAAGRGGNMSGGGSGGSASKFQQAKAGVGAYKDSRRNYFQQRHSDQKNRS
jgi:type IV secretion system protein VirB6